MDLLAPPVPCSAPKTETVTETWKETEEDVVAKKCSSYYLHANIEVEHSRLERPGSHGETMEEEGEEEEEEVDDERTKGIKELHVYLDMVEDMVRPGCSQEMLKVALNSVSSLFNILTLISTTPRPCASL